MNFKKSVLKIVSSIIFLPIIASSNMLSPHALKLFPEESNCFYFQNHTKIILSTNNKWKLNNRTMFNPLFLKYVNSQGNQSENRILSAGTYIF